MRRALSPLTLMTLCWGSAGMIATLTLMRLDDLPLVTLFMIREGLTVSAFNMAGLSWLLIALLAYALGDYAAQITRKRRHTRTPAASTRHLARLIFCVNLVLLGVTLVWIMIAAAKSGGLLQLASATYLDSLGARALLLDSKLFTGMRLFYAALPATACLAAGLLATTTLPPRARRMMWTTLLMNTAALFLLPIVMSQRLLLLQLLLSSYIIACIVKRRIFGLKWLALGMAIFFALWVAREAVTNPFVTGTALQIASQKLAFYVVNDLWNAFAPLNADIPHTGGALAFKGLMFFTLTDGYFQTRLAPTMAQLETVLGGGEFPFLTAAFVDFGTIGGALFIAITAFIIRAIYTRATRSLAWACVYAQIGAALLFSSHSVYFTHQNFIFSLLVIWAITTCARRSPMALPQPPALPATLPDSIMRHMAIFTSCRGKTPQFKSCRTAPASKPRIPHHEPA